jgi:predicted dehydrogenase
MAIKYDVPMIYADYRAMIETDDLDAVVVSTPDDLHYPMTMAALDAGLHVLCEKPMALNVAQAQEMHEKAQAVGVKTMICFTRRWIPPYIYIKQLLDRGYLGHCYHCHITHLGGYGRSAQYRWKWDQRRGLGILGDLGSHAIDLLRWYVGEIVGVSAHLGVHVARPEPEPGTVMDQANDTAFLSLEFDSGAQGTIEASAMAHIGDRGQEHHLRLYGESGTLERVETFVQGSLVGARQDEEQLRELPVPDELWRGVDRTQPPMAQWTEVFCKQSVADRQFIDAILDDLPVEPSFYDGLQAQRVIDAAIRSHEQGMWVSLNAL